MLDNKKIGNYIQMLRKRAELTQEELGERLGITAQSVSNWERGESLPDTTLLPELALILETSVDELLGGGSCGWIYRRRITVERMREAILCVKKLKELLGEEHFMYRTMRDALDRSMNSSVEEALVSDVAFDAYVCEAVIECVKQGDYVDLTDVKKNIHAEKPKEYTLKILGEMGIK